jgi:hypothetical protein
LTWFLAEAAAAELLIQMEMITLLRVALAAEVALKYTFRLHLCLAPSQLRWAQVAQAVLPIRLLLAALAEQVQSGRLFLSGVALAVFVHPPSVTFIIWAEAEEA